MNTEVQTRQGDIYLLPLWEATEIGLINIDDISKVKMIAQDQYTLAYGETTGHSHVLKGNVDFHDENGQILCNIKGENKLVHEEHNHIINIPQGNYLVINQRELDITENTARRVMD